LVGFVAIFLTWFRRYRRVTTAMRAARPLPLESEVPVRSTAQHLEPGIFGIFRPVLLLPDGITDRLTAQQLTAILAHEMCHVRRRDNLTSVFHMAVQSIFWFHPLVLVDRRAPDRRA
jgi:beta-lactamase regulating signal transducer with metallopeptidase domain